jgi:hypothetical protein
MSIDRTPIGWHEEKTVEIKFSMTFNQCTDIPKGSRFKMLLYYYDNTGHQIDRDVDGDPFPNDFMLNLISTVFSSCQPIGVRSILISFELRVCVCRYRTELHVVSVA